MGSTLLRWLLVGALIYLAAVLYAVILGLALVGLFPEVAARQLSLLPGESMLLRTLEAAVEWGTLAGMVMGPCLGFTLVRDFNASIERPEEDRRWWVAAHKMTLRTIALVAVGSAALSGAAALVLWIQGAAADRIQWQSFRALLFGHLLMAFIVTFGYFLRGHHDGRIGADPGSITPLE